MTFGLEPEMSSYGAAPELRKNHKLWQKTYELTKNLSKVVITVDFGVLVPIDINPDNKIINPPTRPLFSVTITYLTIIVLFTNSGIQRSESYDRSLGELEPRK